jgi:hypothetical protein
VSKSGSLDFDCDREMIRRLWQYATSVILWRMEWTSFGSQNDSRRVVSSLEGPCRRLARLVDCLVVFRTHSVLTRRNEDHKVGKLQYLWMGVWSRSHFDPSRLYFTLIICNQRLDLKTWRLYRRAKPELNRCRKSTISREGESGRVYDGIL